MSVAKLIEARLVDAIITGRLDPSRIDEASGRVLALASDLAGERDAVAVPDFVTSDDEPQLELARAVAAFEVSPDAHRWIRESAGAGEDVTFSAASRAWALRIGQAFA